MLHPLKDFEVFFFFFCTTLSTNCTVHSAEVLQLVTSNYRLKNGLVVV